MVTEDIQRFEVWLVRLDPTKGSEIKRTRPCAVISPKEMSALKTVIVAPMTSKGFIFPTRIQCTFQKKKGLVLLDQLRAVNKGRLVQRLGVLSQQTQIKIINCLQELFAY